MGSGSVGRCQDTTAFYSPSHLSSCILMSSALHTTIHTPSLSLSLSLSLCLSFSVCIFHSLSVLVISLAVWPLHTHTHSLSLSLSLFLSLNPSHLSSCLSSARHTTINTPSSSISLSLSLFFNLFFSLFFLKNNLWWSSYYIYPSSYSISRTRSTYSAPFSWNCGSGLRLTGSGRKKNDS